jgi:CRISPR-associated protein Cas2
MIILILEHAPASLRGHLSRWLLQLKPGVFVGNVSARIRDVIWEKVQHYEKPVDGILLFKSNTEQGFRIRTWGSTWYEVCDLDGFYVTKHSVHKNDKNCQD